jgi:hypothetical protein
MIAVGAQRILTLPAEEADRWQRCPTRRKRLARCNDVAPSCGRQGPRRHGRVGVRDGHHSATDRCSSTSIPGAEASIWCWAVRTCRGCAGPARVAEWTRRVGGLRAALPVHHGIAVLSAGQAGGQVAARSTRSSKLDVAEATVVCDLPRKTLPQSSPACVSRSRRSRHPRRQVLRFRRRHRPMARRRERERRTRVRGAPGGLTRETWRGPSVFRASPPCVLNRAWPLRWSGRLRPRRRSPLASAARRIARGAAAAAGRVGCRVSASLIERVRERLAAESMPLRPNVVAAAIRAESDWCAWGYRGSRQSARPADGTLRRWHPRATAVRRGHHGRWSPHPTQCGSTTVPACGARQSNSPMTLRWPTGSTAGAGPGGA